MITKQTKLYTLKHMIFSDLKKKNQIRKNLSYLKGRRKSAAYKIVPSILNGLFIAVTILNLILLCAANNLMTAYLAIELQSIAFYLMIASKKDFVYSEDSFSTYITRSCLSSTFFLCGSAIINATVGSLHFDNIRKFVSLVSISFPETAAKNSILLEESTISLANDQIERSISDSLESLNHHSVLLSEKSVLSFTINDHEFANVRYNSNLSHRSFDLLGKFQFHFNPEAQTLQDIRSIYETTFMGTNPETAFLNSLNLNFLYFGLILLCLSVFLKLSLTSFHFWSLDVNEKSPYTTTTFFGVVVPKIGLIVLLIKLCYTCFYSNFFSIEQPYLSYIVVFNIFMIGPGGWLVREKFKCALVYNFVTSTGYISLSANFTSLEGTDIMMLLYYFVFFATSGLCFWFILIEIFTRKK